MRIFFVAFALFFSTSLGAQRPKPSGPSSHADRQAAWERHQELRKSSLFRPASSGGRWGPSSKVVGSLMWSPSPVNLIRSRLPMPREDSGGPRTTNQESEG